MKPRHRSDVQHAYWLLEKRKIVRVSSPVLRGTGTQGLRRPRFPFFVLQCQRAVERVVETTLPNPQWNQKARWESTTAEDRPGSEKTRGIPRNCQWVARSRIVPQEVGATRAEGVFRVWSGQCQWTKNRFLEENRFGRTFLLKPLSLGRRGHIPA